MSYIVTTARLAQLLDLTPRAVRLMVPDGLPRVRPGRFDLEAVVPWYASRLRDRLQERETPAIVQARIRLVGQQARRWELENERRAAELVEAEAVLQALAAILEIVAAELYRLASKRLARRLVKVAEPPAIQRELFNECRATRERIAAQIENMLSNLPALA